MRQLLLAVSLFAAACDGRLVRIDSKLSVEPGELTFERTVAGYTRASGLTLINGSRAPVAVHLSSPAPFALELDVTLAGGEARAIDVTFAPAEPGSSTATLHVTGEYELDVALGGEAVAPAVCASPSACRSSTLDVDTNTCVEANAPDGAACTSDNACLSAGRCLAGACIGAATSCDDADACTVDACEPSGGCLHSARACPEPADLCHVARCDSAAGCLVDTAPDGTACGPSDCTTAHVCMSGTCRALTVPEGYACGEATPCRGKGRCSAGSCSLPEPGPLTESWHVQLSAAADFRGVTDASGNLYWLECHAVRTLNPCELVSYTPMGFPRFRVTVPTLSAATTFGTHHLSSQGRIVVGGPSASLAAFSDTSGALLWSRAGAGDTTLLELAADSTGRVLTLVRFAGESESFVLSELVGTTGETAASTPLNGRAAGLVLDAQDNRYVAVTPFSLVATPIPISARIESYTSGGALRWSVPWNGGAPVAAYGGELLLANGQVLSTVDGQPRPGQRRYTTFAAPAPVMSAGARFRWQDEIGCGDSAYGGAWQYLESFTPGVELPRFSWSTVAYSPQASEMQLLSDGTALFASTSASIYTVLTEADDVFLRAVEAGGGERFACRIGPAGTMEGPIRYTGGTALTAGRWAVVEKRYCSSCVIDPPPVLRVFSTPGLSVAASGWTGPRGRPSGSGAPR